MIIRKLFIILSAALLVGCSAVTLRAGRAEEALNTYFYELNRGDYLLADSYYAGEYETLISMNPVVDPSDHAKLWSNACQFNGFTCMQILRTTFLEYDDYVFSFEVEFKLADGSQFSRGACCGENPESVESQATFIYRVLETTEKEYKVLDLPVYIP
jgi:hypothetical protein